MRNLLLWLTAASLALTGCSGRQSAPAGFEHLAGRNLSQEPIRWLDDQKFKHLAEKQAKTAWQAQQFPDKPSRDYECGFHEGFVDYLDAGGNGEPPVAPRFRYRLTHFMTPQGQSATADWFAGFRHGSAVAKASGLRELILVPLSGPVTQPEAPQMPMQVGPRETPRQTQPKTLPAPRPVEKSKKPSEKLPPPKREPANNGELLPKPRNDDNVPAAPGLEVTILPAIQSRTFGGAR